MKQNQQVKALSGEIVMLRVKEAMDGKGWNVDLKRGWFVLCYSIYYE
jgi:hypothetical protein